MPPSCIGARFAVSNQSLQAGDSVLGASEERMLDGIEDQICGHRSGGSPPEDSATVGVDDERHVREPHPGRHIREVGYLQPIWRRCVEATIDQVGVAHVTVVGDGRLALGPVPCAPQPCSPRIRSTGHPATSWPWPRSQIRSLRDPRVCTNLPFVWSSRAAVMISTSSASRSCRRVGVLAIH